MMKKYRLCETVKDMSKGITGIQKAHLEVSKQICLPGTKGFCREIGDSGLSIPFPQSLACIDAKVLIKYLCKRQNEFQL